MVFEIRLQRMGWVSVLYRFRMFHLSCVIVWCLSFLDVSLIKSLSCVSWSLVGSGLVSGCIPRFLVYLLLHVLLHLKTQLLTVELHIMILEVTLTCILMQDEFLERLVCSSVSFTCLFICLLLFTCYVSFTLYCMTLLIDYTYWYYNHLLWSLVGIPWLPLMLEIKNLNFRKSIGSNQILFIKFIFFQRPFLSL